MAKWRGGKARSGTAVAMEGRGRGSTQSKVCTSHIPSIDASSQREFEEGHSHETTDDGLPAFVSENLNLLPFGLALMRHWGFTLERGETSTQGSEVDGYKTQLKTAHQP